MLIVGDDLLTADGLVLAAASRYLVDAPSGAIAVPAKPRSPHASLNHSRHAAGPEDKATTDALEAATRKYDACQAKIEGPVTDKMLAMQANGLTFAEERQIAAMQTQTRNKVNATCKPEALRKLTEARWTELMQTRTARRQRALTAAQARLTGLFH